MSKEEYAKIYTNLPVQERSNVIYVHDKYGPMSWMVVKLESDFDTEIGIEARNFIATI